MGTNHRARRAAAAVFAVLLVAVVPVVAAPPPPDRLTVMPAPNDDGTHVALSWPVVKTDETGWQYVIFASRGPDRYWFSCGTVAPDSGFISDPEVAAWFPYHFSSGEEHYAIVQPTACMDLYWLDAARRYRSAVDQASGSLQDCEQHLLAVERYRAQLSDLRARFRYYKPLWEEELRRAKESYIRQASLSVMPEQLDVPKLWSELAGERTALLEKRDEGELDGAGRERLRDVETRLDLLRPARRYSDYLSESDERIQGLGEAIIAARDACLAKAAEFAGLYRFVEDQSRVQIGAALDLAAYQVTPAAVASGLPVLEEELAAARGGAETENADAAQYDAYDALRFAHFLARAYVEREEKRIALDEIQNDVLWQLHAQLEGLDVPGLGAPPSGAESPDSEALLAALEGDRRAGVKLDVATEPAGRNLAERQAAAERLAEVRQQWAAAETSVLAERLANGRFVEPKDAYLRREQTRLQVLASAAMNWLKGVERDFDGRRYWFGLATADQDVEVSGPTGPIGSAAPEAAVFDMAKLTNFIYALFFAAAVLGMLVYVRRNPDVFVRRIAGLEAVDEAIGRATEMGKPALFVHGLSGVSDVTVLASLSILSRIARRIADHESDLLVVNNDPIVYSISYEVVQEGYSEAGRPDAFKPDNIFMASDQQFPYVAAVAGIMARRQPAANFFMGYFYAESLILAEVGSTTGAIQIAATDAFLQIPFFITTCDYTLMGEELYAAGAYLSQNAKMLATLKAQDIGKAVLMVALPVGSALSNFGFNWLSVIFQAYEKGF